MKSRLLSILKELKVAFPRHTNYANEKEKSKDDDASKPVY